MSARSALSHTVHKRLTNTYLSEMKWHDTKKHNATKLPKQKLLVKINERRMIFVNKIATPDLSLHRFFFNKCTHKWHQIVIPFFPCDGFQQKRGLFLLDVAMVFFKTTEHCLEVSQVILTVDLIHSPPHSLFLIMFVISVIFSASSSFTLLFSCKIIPPSVFFTRRAVSLAPGL